MSPAPPDLRLALSPPEVPLSDEPTQRSSVPGRRRRTPDLRDLPIEDPGDRYEGDEEVGHGGTSRVYRTEDRALRRVVALKRLNPRQAEDADAVARFVAEARVLSQLEHPNIAPLHSLACDAEGRPYLSMKLVEGETLGRRIQRLGPTRLWPENLRALVKILLRVCDAVAYAHSRGVIHRDIKPTNIMVGAFGQVYLMDWGTARLLSERAAPELRALEEEGALAGVPGEIIGTPQYMPPEQASGHTEQTDERSDIFALGATLYAVLAGRAPHQGRGVDELLALARACQITPPEQVCPGLSPPSELCRAAMRALSPDPAARYQDVLSFQADLEQYLRGREGLPTRSMEPGELLVREGDPGDTAYILLEGRCEVFVGEGEDERVLRVLGPGEVFGETAALLSRPRTASVRALTAGSLVVIDRAALMEALGVHGWVEPFVRALAERFRDIDDRVRRLEEPE